MANSPDPDWGSRARQAGYFLWPGLVVAGLVWGLAPTSQAQNWIRSDFRQTQTRLSVTIESSQNINSSHWSYAGPLDDRSQCSDSEFPKLDDNLKGRAAVTKLGNKKARAEISISRADNNRLYCFIIEGSPTPRRLDYDPPIIELGEGNLIKARDAPSGAYGPSGNVNSNSWRAAVFDAGRAGDGYRCNAENQQLSFRPVAGDAKYIGQYSWGNINHLAYNVPDHRQSAIEFFDNLKVLLDIPETIDPALIPFVDGQWNPDFSDNIHLCHRVSDPQGNTSYKLMRLDFGGPAISLKIVGRSVRASSPAVDLDDSTWQYLATDQRHIQTTCELLENLSDPSGRSAIVDPATKGHYYCFLVADKQGNIGRAWIRAKLGQASPTPAETTMTSDPPAGDNQPQNQQAADPAPTPDQPEPEPIDGQAGGVDEVETAPGTDTPVPPTTANQPAVEAAADPAGQNRLDPANDESSEPGNDEAGGGSIWLWLGAAIAGLLLAAAGWLVWRAKARTKNDP